jgi:hypothetical protein
VGAFLGPFLLPLLAATRGGLRWRLLLSLRDPDFRRYLLPALPIMLAFGIVGVDDWVWTRFASVLPEGSVATLQYAKRLAMVPIGVFGMAAGMAAYPTLSRLCAEGDTAEAWRTILRASKLTLLLAFGAQVVLTVTGADIGAAVFGTTRIAPEQQLVDDDGHGEGEVEGRVRLRTARCLVDRDGDVQMEAGLRHLDRLEKPRVAFRVETVGGLEQLQAELLGVVGLRLGRGEPLPHVAFPGLEIVPQLPMVRQRFKTVHGCVQVRSGGRAGRGGSCLPTRMEPRSLLITPMGESKRLNKRIARITVA